MFRIDRCAFGITYQDKDYDLGMVDSWVVEDPETKSLVRGANRVSKRGLVLRAGGKTPCTITISLVGFEKQLVDILNNLYDSEAEFTAYVIDGATGESRFAKRCLNTTRVRQGTISEDEATMNVDLILHSFDIDEDLK